MKKAKEKVWLAEDRKTLVKDGDPSAAFLFARKGQEISDSSVEGFKGAGSFFEDINKPHPEPTEHVLDPGPDLKPGYTNVGKPAKTAKQSKADAASQKEEEAEEIKFSKKQK